MDIIQNSFKKVKEEINFLKQEMAFLKQSLSETREQIIEICGILTKLVEKQAPTHTPLNQTSTTHSSTLPQEIEGLKDQNLSLSIGNEGVPTDRQTDRQTDQQTQKTQKNQEELSVDRVAEILESLDNLRKGIRLKFKRLTDQEWTIFLTIYQLDEQYGFTDYKTLAEKLKLTESSIRDYIGRLIRKGIPVEKNKINNKTIHLSISQNLKKVVSLSTIIQLREI